MSIVDYYNRHAEAFHKQYLSTSTEDVHESWLNTFLPESGVVLDLGAGVGRDALYFAQQGLEVIAVEPSTEFIRLGQTYTAGHSVRWLEDRLPELIKVYALQIRFDLIVLSAVWMHVPPSQRDRAFRKITNLLKPGGRLAVSLRHGPNSDGREMFPVSIDELNLLSRKYGVSVCHTQANNDTLAREAVYWETVVMQLPDDGSGAFPVIRNILINDAKSSTYKLALIRTLLRIADGHPGAVTERSDNMVSLPLGLVSLLWARQYKLLLDANIQQSSNPQKGLGFIKQEGWLRLDHFTGQDFSIGHVFLGSDASALHRTLKDICKTIRDMPVRYIRMPNSQTCVFEADINRTPNSIDSLYLDLPSLRRYGSFRLPVKIWDLMTQYACWIEPVVLNEWAQVMKSYQNNLHVSPNEFMQRLEWQDAHRTTLLARKRVDELRQSKAVRCVWSPTHLKGEYDIDHCLPFSRWPNNDLWNLLPSTKRINNAKSDRIPTDKRLGSARGAILDWWHSAWQEQAAYQTRFFTEASFSLPGIAPGNENLDDLFEALRLQSMRVAEMQQIPRW